MSDRFFIKRKKDILIISLPAVILLLIAVFYANINDVVIFPFKNDFSYYTYTDEPVGGCSRVADINSDSLVTLKYQLGETFYSPYIGITVFNEVNKYFPVTKQNELHIEIRGEEADRVGISFFTSMDSVGEKMFHSYLNISPEFILYKISFNDFKNPEWWADKHQLPIKTFTLEEKKNILNLNIGSAYTPNKVENKFIEIRSIRIVRNNKSLYLILISIEIGIILLYFLYKKQRKNKKKVTVIYKAIDIEENSKEDVLNFITYINENIYDSELSLTKIADKLSISQRVITEEIQKKFGLNFNSYINRIRINEAKRLLKSSDLNISEIAFKVGFNSHSNFNRVFKNEENISPTTYRNKG